MILTVETSFTYEGKLQWWHKTNRQRLVFIVYCIHESKFNFFVKFIPLVWFQIYGIIASTMSFSSSYLWTRDYLLHHKLIDRKYSSTCKQNILSLIWAKNLMLKNCIQENNIKFLDIPWWIIFRTKRLSN